MENKIKNVVLLALWVLNFVFGMIRLLIIEIPLKGFVYITSQYRRDTREERALRLADMYIMVYYAGFIGLVCLILDDVWLNGKMACRMANRMQRTLLDKINK